ncbi:hypothetical protein TRICI_001015 [Trichomonascus ciferrii]|uniref:F-box domain-containing protein n=1 Tax=Trichomonascus ciferrii TaxID=44093 RepID=A0A642VBS0_9ASCO|nr:hypothetical protein TRICI_001015 [Trichomonascus ciferrii]
MSHGMSLTDLPVELVQRIGLYAIDSIPDLSQTCRYLRLACQYNGLWARYCNQFYKEMGLSEIEINEIGCYRGDYWRIRRDNRKLHNLYTRLKKCDETEHECRCELITKITEYGPRARLVLNQEARASLTNSHVSDCAIDEEPIDARHKVEAVGLGCSSLSRKRVKKPETSDVELEGLEKFPQESTSHVIGESEPRRRWSWGSTKQDANADWTSFRRRWSSGSVNDAPASTSCAGECPSFRRRCSAAFATRPNPVGLEAGPQENIDTQFSESGELLSLITRRRVLTIMTRISQDPSCFTALDIFFALNDRFPQEMADSRYKTMFDQMVNTTHVPENAKPAEILQALSEAQKHLELPIHSSTMIDRRKYKSVVYIFAYCTLLKNNGYHAIPYLHQGGLKWQAFIKILNDEDEPYYLLMANQAERYTENQLDQLVKTCNIRWSSMKQIVCGFTRIFAQLSAPRTVCDRLLAVMEALFETNGRFLQWKTEHSIELLNPHDTFRSSQGSTFSAEEMARTFLHILQKWDPTVIIPNNPPSCVPGSACALTPSW